MTTIAAQKTENQNFKTELYRKPIIINNLTEKRNTFQANKKWLLPSSNTKCVIKKQTEKKALELDNRFSTLEDEYPIVEQEI